MQITVLLAVFVWFILVSGEDVNNGTESSLFDDRLFFWGVAAPRHQMKLNAATWITIQNKPNNNQAVQSIRGMNNVIRCSDNKSQRAI